MAIIPPRYLNSLVAIGNMVNTEFKCIATGFIYGIPIPGEENDEGGRTFSTYLVTNRHVISNQNAPLVARYNLSSGPAATPQPLAAGWTEHPDADVAVTPVDARFIMSENVEFYLFIDGETALSREQANDAEISEGNGVFVLGFPLQLAGEDRNYVIVRQGVVARIQDWLRGDEETFLIDASIFPGNSGGPVVTKPEGYSIRGTPSYRKCSLIGMVSSYIPYREVAISEQTNRPRMIFEENSGLGRVVPVNAIQETIKLASSSMS